VYKLTFKALWLGVLFVLVSTLSNMHPFVWYKPLFINKKIVCT
jgi:hypothetical protein